MGPVLMRWTFVFTLSRLLQFQLQLLRGQVALAFVDVGVEFADRAKTSTTISTTRTNEHRTTKEEMEGLTSS